MNTNINMNNNQISILNNYLFSDLQGRYYSLFLSADTPEKAAALLKETFRDIDSINVVEDIASGRVYFDINLGTTNVLASGVQKKGMGYLIGNIHLTGILATDT